MPHSESFALVDATTSWTLQITRVFLMNHIRFQREGNMWKLQHCWKAVIPAWILTAVLIVTKTFYILNEKFVTARELTSKVERIVIFLIISALMLYIQLTHGRSTRMLQKYFRKIHQVNLMLQRYQLPKSFIRSDATYSCTLLVLFLVSVAEHIMVNYSFYVAYLDGRGNTMFPTAWSSASPIGGGGAHAYSMTANIQKARTQVATVYYEVCLAQERLRAATRFLNRAIDVPLLMIVTLAFADIISTVSYIFLESGPLARAGIAPIVTLPSVISYMALQSLWAVVITEACERITYQDSELRRRLSEKLVWSSELLAGTHEFDVVYRHLQLGTGPLHITAVNILVVGRSLLYTLLCGVVSYLTILVQQAQRKC